MQKIGIFGGTFNPPHIAHLVAAESVRDHLKLEKVLFVPSAIPPHKLNEKIISADFRLEMVNLAVKDFPAFEVCDIELRRGGPSYTIDTIMALKSKFSAGDFFLMIGIDLMRDFYSWKNPEKILDECNVVVMARPGFSIALVDKELLRRVEIINVPGMDISSSDIRRRIKSGKSIKFLVPTAVEEFIYSKLIYQ